jgi:hypothetical protein
MQLGTDQAPPWWVRLGAELDAADARAAALAGGLDERQLNWKPSPASWSVGQCLEHLRVANRVYVDAMASALTDREAGEVVQQITPGPFGRWFIRNYIEPSPGMRRSRAPKKIAPVSRVGGSILDEFLASNREAREFIARARHHNVNRIRFRNPFVPLVRFTVGTGLEILSRHQSRHLLQAEHIRGSAGFQ